ncbi:hypothetical protein BDS110ZK23_06550 [Bradyrhizobium diazoefficiens]|nr:hypothetical protein H12S4_71450 [Bradyrhizobium diazoefficiens]BCF08471.1 hypothetical protein XF12B_38440 [Bradyrhizobium diazoefficiens]BCF11390.1 hypothetical protein XF12B_67630 [Bradyrhizobium diazoefficiens]
MDAYEGPSRRNSSIPTVRGRTWQARQIDQRDHIYEGHCCPAPLVSNFSRRTNARSRRRIFHDTVRAPPVTDIDFRSPDSTYLLNNPTDIVRSYGGSFKCV